jgi:tetratricopeptide (TPR) repeat protein
MDPAIWFNDGTPAQTYADAIAGSAARQRLFAGYGGLEADIDKATGQFAQRLEARRPATVGFAHRRYQNDSHALVPLSAFPDGLRFIFEQMSTQRLPIATLDSSANSTAVVEALAASESQHAAAARSLLLPEALPEIALTRLARFALNTLKNVDLSIRVLERNVALHPESARALAALADGYLSRGDTAAAIVQFRKALASARTSPTALPNDVPAKLRELEKGRAIMK